MAVSTPSDLRRAATAATSAGSNNSAARHASARDLLSSRHTRSRALWNTIRPFAYGIIAIGGFWFGMLLVTQGALYAIPLWLISFFASLFAVVGISRDIGRRRKLRAWLGTRDAHVAIQGAEDARQHALLSPPWLQAAYYARKEELRRLPLPKESLRALRVGARRKGDDFTFSGCCGPR